VTKEIEVNKALVAKLTLYLPFSDVHDYKEKKFKATLLRDMSGVVVTMPTVATFLFNNVAELHALEGTEVCRATERSHKVVGVLIKGNNMAQLKEVTYLFPKGMTCNNKLFNQTVSGDLKLSNNLRFLQTVEGTITQMNPFIFWEMAIDGETRRLETSSSADDEDAINKAMKRMSNMNISAASS
jgi:hypothetical protein